MKSTGIVRKVDELGRVVLPIELRRALNITEGDALEIYLDDASIVLKKRAPACVFCSSPESISTFREKSVCGDCLRELSK